MLKIEFSNGTYKAYANGEFLAESGNKYYLKQKAEKLIAQRKIPVKAAPKSEFPINQRFDFVSQLVTMVATKQTPSCVIVGEGGLGKSYTVIDALKKAGLKDISDWDVGVSVPNMKAFRVIKGYSTAKGLYRVLFENQNNILVFDDLDIILRDAEALNLLKGALDSFDKRTISWNTSVDNDGLPRSFEFKGGIVFISNMKAEKVDQAIRSRSMFVDLTMTLDEKIDRMKEIMKNESFLPGIAFHMKEEALEAVREFKDIAREISLRSLIMVTKIRNSGNANWKQLAKYAISN